MAFLKSWDFISNSLAKLLPILKHFETLRRMKKRPKPLIYKGFRAFLRSFRVVEVTGLEPAASCSQSKRATNCATPRYHNK